MEVLCVVFVVGAFCWPLAGMGWHSGGRGERLEGGEWCSCSCSRCSRSRRDRPGV